MATLNDLLNNFGLDGMDEDVGEEKVASEHATDDDEQALLESLLAGGQEKTASEGGAQMGSLADLYMQLTEEDSAVGYEEDDFDKVASAAVEEEASIEKLAAEYDAAGRIMARGFFDEFHKLARELEEGSDAATPALGDRGTQYQMETNYEGKGPMHTKGSQNVNADAIKGGAGTDLGAEKAMGPQFTTAKHLVTSRAGQANAK
jgi:hypothetical protein